MEAVKIYRAGLITQAQLFDLIFSHEALLNTFNEKFERTSGKGIDRINGAQFSARAPAEFRVAEDKIRAGSYRFSPYLESLKPKGRDKPPRLIGIPTIRDRVVLNHLNAFLAAVFPGQVPKNIASTYVRSIANDLGGRDPKATWVCGTDIRTFYDSIQRDRLHLILSKKISVWQVVRLISRSVRTPTVPKDARHALHSEYATDRGVPQGLAISNILAAIYMQEVDDAMTGIGVTYYRYVDDVLIYGEREPVHKAYKSLRARLRWRGLGLHPLGSSKTQIVPLRDSFTYLGYVFNWPEITVRTSTRERFLQGIAAMFSEFVHEKKFKLARYAYLTEDRLKEIFMLELNERISGAISGNRRYGWIAYFNQITDLLLLHQLDRAIEKMFKRLDEFANVAPPQLKRLGRAYYEMKYRPEAGYVHNYDQITTRAQKLEFLTRRGRIAPHEVLTDAEIDSRFEAYRNRVLADMHADEGVVYG